MVDMRGSPRCSIDAELPQNGHGKSLFVTVGPPSALGAFVAGARNKGLKLGGTVFVAAKPLSDSDQKFHERPSVVRARMAKAIAFEADSVSVSS